MFATGIIGVDQLEEHAQRNAMLHSRYLKWEAILRNLVLNDLIAEEHWAQLEVHYRWLSAFAHATQTGYDLIERECGHPSWGKRGRSHLLGELALLYAATFAVDELQWFCEFVDKRAHMIELSNRTAIDRSISQVRALTGYFWWPGSSPDDFDRVTEANHRAWKAYQPGEGDGWPSPPDPASLADADIGYYVDPYDRLKRMHEGFNEITTGLGYSPPW
jgi:hypothetical protein